MPVTRCSQLWHGLVKIFVLFHALVKPAAGWGRRCALAPQVPLWTCLNVCPPVNQMVPTLCCRPQLAATLVDPASGRARPVFTFCRATVCCLSI